MSNYQVGDSGVDRWADETEAESDGESSAVASAEGDGEEDESVASANGEGDNDHLWLETFAIWHGCSHRCRLQLHWM